jgi:hypothetical protein
MEEYNQKDIHVRRFTKALFNISKSGKKPKNPQTDESLSKCGKVIKWNLEILTPDNMGKT